MSGILLLCHFCEQHGPRMLMTTQVFYNESNGLSSFEEEIAKKPSQPQQHPQQTQQQQELTTSPPSPLASPERKDGSDTFLTPTKPPPHTRDEVNKSGDTSGDLLAPRQQKTGELASTPAPGSGTPQAEKGARPALSSQSDAPKNPHTPSSRSTRKSTSTFVPSSDCCSACGWCVPSPGFVTETPAATYASTHYPHTEELYGLLRQACVQSLSCEVTPGREGPFIFTLNGKHVAFSYTFFLRDHQARGFQRWYSVVYLMTQRHFLISSFPFLKYHVRAFVHELQAKALLNNDSSKKGTDLLNKGVYAPVLVLGSNQHAQRGYRLLRSIPELTATPSIMATVHSYFAWILKAFVSRSFERHVEGPSPIGAPLNATTLDPFNMADRFTLSGTPLLSSNGSSEESSFSSSKSPLPHEETMRAPFSPLNTRRSLNSAEPHQGTFSNTALRRSANEVFEDLPSLDEELTDGTRPYSLVFTHPSYSSPRPIQASGPLFTSLRQIYYVLKQEHFLLVVYNVIIGNQCIVRGSHMGLINSMILVLSSLVPALCTTILVEQVKYRERYLCSFLGLHEGVPIPDHLKRSSYVLVDVQDSTPIYLRTGRHAASNSSSSPQVVFTIHANNFGLAARGCSMMTRLKDFYANDFHSSPELDDQFHASLREEWMQYAKVFFKYSRLPSYNSDNDVLFLKGMSLREEDALVLKYWTQGLTRAHRVKLLLDESRNDSYLTNSVE